MVSEAVDTIARITAPFLGETMARSAAEAHRVKLDLPDGECDEAGLQALVRKTGLGLNVFVGRAIATSLVAQMEQELLERHLERPAP